MARPAQGSGRLIGAGSLPRDLDSGRLIGAGSLPRDLDSACRNGQFEGMGEDKPNPLSDTLKGLGLLFRAARTVASKIPTKNLEETVATSAREVGRAFENVATTLERTVMRHAKPGDGDAPAKASERDASAKPGERDAGEAPTKPQDGDSPGTKRPG